MPPSLIISGATILDAVSEKPIEGHSIWIEGRRIRAIARQDELRAPPGATPIDASGKFLIPGLLNANVHLFGLANLEVLAAHCNRFEAIIAECAQIALKSGLTTVFDTWGPRRALMDVRDQIEKGAIPGSRIFCGGNIIGFDGPFSPDFFPKATDVASGGFAQRINAIWAENVGRQLMWLTPDQVRKHVRSYIALGVDFIKYASNDHFPGAFIAFSPRVQAAIVEEAHRAGITAQAHTMSVEGLHIAIEAGCDLIQHVNSTGPIPIPEETLQLLVERKTGAVVFPWTQRGMDWVTQTASEMEKVMWQSSDANARSLIRCGASLLLGNDGWVLASQMKTDPQWGNSILRAAEDINLCSLTQGHFTWLRAMEEKGCPPLKMLQAATLNIAQAYGKAQDIGSLEAGKLADLLVLDRNPLLGAENYQSIHMVIKDGAVVARDELPVEPVLTRVPEPPSEEEGRYVAFLSASPLPGCCSHR